MRTEFTIGDVVVLKGTDFRMTIIELWPNRPNEPNEAARVIWMDADLHLQEYNIPIASLKKVYLSPIKGEQNELQN
jgi:hypothetical protein